MKNMTTGPSGGADLTTKPSLVARVRGSRRARVAIVVLCLAVVGASVAFLWLRTGPTSIDRAATERAVVDAVEAHTGEGNLDASCPVHLPKETGHQVTCRVEVADGEVLRVAVRQSDDRANLEVTFTDLLVERVQVATDAEAMLADEYEEAFEVRCGPRGWVVLSGDRTLSCTVVSGSDVGGLEVSVDDAGEPVYRVTT